MMSNTGSRKMKAQQRTAAMLAPVPNRHAALNRRRLVELQPLGPIPVGADPSVKHPISPELQGIDGAMHSG
eukprot:6197453-Amphidinium_carterae.1